jgi:7,8-didemethyl-8-hydroxy-5-deazariboflavin synthase CofH subunit
MVDINKVSTMTSIDQLMGSVTPTIAHILDQALQEKELTVDQGVSLLGTTGLDMMALFLTADAIRRRKSGDLVTYVVNRNINFTNVCIKGCTFCAFSRDFREEEGYLLPLEEIVRRAREAWDLGATEVCIQAGLPPKMKGSLYIDLTKALKKELPDLHIHGFSPEEVLYGSIRSRWTIEEYLLALKEAGVGSLPGTSAEILDQELRDRISPGRISVSKWVEVITTAHRLGIPTTSTIMFGHVETPVHQAKHLALLRELQKETGGFTEFVPLSLVYEEAPMYREGLVPGVRRGATGEEVVKMHAVSRLMLSGFIDNIQVSWVKEGPKLSQLCLQAGANDLGGTLMNESISTAAGAQYGQLVPPRELRRIVWNSGRTPAERTTNYGLRHIFEEGDDPTEPLDLIGDRPEERFGSYQQLVQLKDYRFKDEFARQKGQHKTLSLQDDRKDK